MVRFTVSYPWKIECCTWPACPTKRSPSSFVGVSQGFWVSFDRLLSLRAAQGNLASVEENPSAVGNYHDGELREATIRLAFQGETVHVSPIGLFPKGGQPEKFRLIVDLSSPLGASVNDGINPDLCSLSFVQGLSSSSRSTYGAGKRRYLPGQT